MRLMMKHEPKGQLRVDYLLEIINILWNLKSQPKYNKLHLYASGKTEAYTEKWFVEGQGIIPTFLFFLFS